MNRSLMSRSVASTCAKTAGVSLLAGTFVFATTAPLAARPAATTAPAGAGPAVSFGPNTDYAVGDYPSSVAVGDVNGDGNLDIVTNNYNDDTISVLLGNGSGSFGAQTTFGTGDGPWAVALGDVNRDGNLDVVTANYAGDTVSVLPGDGTGSFGSYADHAVGIEPYGVALGDVNGDGNLDIVTANYDDDTASVLLGDGAGGFTSQTPPPDTGSAPTGVALGDVNGDGNLDIVTVNYGDATASVLLGTGTGTFAGKSDYATGDYPYAVALGDVDGDGNLDIVTANGESSSGADGSASVLLGTGTGSFGAKTDFGIAGDPESVALGDMNGDGNLDMVLGNDVIPGYVVVRLGKGNGSFGAQKQFSAGADVKGVTLGDLNGNRHLDIVTANETGLTASVLLNTTLFNQTITFRQPADSSLGAGTVPLNATSNSGLPITYTSYTSSVCTIDSTGTSAKLLSTGSCAIAANQAGDSGWNPAVSVVRTFEVSDTAMLDQTITFPQPADSSLSAGTVPLNATSNSGLPITYTSYTSSVCTIDSTGTTAKLIGPGSCAIAASQAGNSKWKAAATVVRTFKVSDSAVEVGDTKLTVKARKKGKALSPEKRTKVVRSATTNANIKKVKANCYVFGNKVTGKDKQAVCEVTVKKLRKNSSNARVWVKPKCSVGVKVRVSITANAKGMNKATWKRSWKVKDQPRSVCALNANG